MKEKRIAFLSYYYHEIFKNRESNTIYQRQMILLLFLSCCPFLPLDSLFRVLIEGEGISQASAGYAVTKAVSKKWIEKHPKKFHEVLSLYEVTERGCNELLRALKEETELRIPIPTFYNVAGKPLPKQMHKIYSSITLCHVILIFYPLASLAPETRLSLDTLSTLNDARESGSLAPDIHVEFPFGNSKNLFLEIDTTSEYIRGTRRNFLAPKLKDYAYFSYIYSGAYRGSNIQVVLPLFFPMTKDSFNDSPSFGSLSAAVRWEPNQQLCFFSIWATCAHERYGDSMTIGNVRDFAKEKANSSQYSEQYSSMVGPSSFRQVLDYLCDHTEWCEASYTCYSDSIKWLKEYVAKGVLADRVQSQDQVLRKRLAAIFKYIVGDHLASENTYPILYQQLLRGMMLAAYMGDSPRETLPFLLPERFFTERLSYLPFLIKAMPGTEYDASSASDRGRCIGLIDCYSDSDRGRTYSGSLMYSRLVRNTGSFLLCLENISHDIGGFLRVKNYLSLPHGTLKNVLMVVLVRDDYMLADGSHLKDLTIYRDGYRTSRNDILPFVMDGHTDNYHIYSYTDRFIRSSNPGFSYEDDELPFLMRQSQDICFLTYSEFQKALTSSAYVSAWIPDVRGESLWKIRRIYCPPHLLLPSFTGTLADGYVSCNQEQILRNVV